MAKIDNRWRIETSRVSDLLSQIYQDNLCTAETLELWYPVIQFIAYLASGEAKTAAMRSAISTLNAYTHQEKSRMEPWYLQKLSSVLHRDKVIKVFPDYATAVHLPTGRHYNRFFPVNEQGKPYFNMRIHNGEQLKAYVWACRFAYRLALIDEFTESFQHTIKHRSLK